MRYRFYSYLSAFVCSIYGHRPTVLSNMMVEEVKEAKKQGHDSIGYVINICVKVSADMLLLCCVLYK